MRGGSREPRAQPVLLREAAARDLDSFLRCLDVVARERRYLAMVEGPTRAEAEAFLADAHARGMVQQVAVAGADVVGWCDVIRKPLPGFEHSGTLGMGLLPEYRGRGLGARLLAAALEAVAPLGITRIELDVFSTNARAIALYEKCGFVREGVKRAARVLDGRTEDIVCMARVEERTRSAIR